MAATASAGAAVPEDADSLPRAPGAPLKLDQLDGLGAAAAGLAPVPLPAPISSLKKPEDLRFEIRSSDPIGQDTAVYEFNKYAMPIGTEPGDKKDGDSVAARLHAMERYLATLVARTTVLLGRSSGRDKVAATVQYFAMFWGAQPFVDITGIKDGPNAPWKLLEDSMSNGRKVFRLGKWIKEYEKARVALTAPDSYIGVVSGGRLQALLTRILAVSMNTFSFLYYWFDNMIWAAQANLINRSPQEVEIRTLLFSAYPTIPYEKYVEMQSRHKEAIELRRVANRRIEKWKDCKNYASLWRLIFAMVHCVTQLRSLGLERDRLVAKYADRVQYAANAARGISSDPPTPSPRMDRADSAPDDIVDRWARRKVEDVAQERDSRLKEVDSGMEEQRQELLAAACNLGILLNRLKFPFFKRLPLWVIGVLGTVSGYVGCIKNWPKFVAPPKPNKVAKLRTESFDRINAA